MLYSKFACMMREYKGKVRGLHYPLKRKKEKRKIII